jgi:hypothetical protein
MHQSNGTNRTEQQTQSAYFVLNVWEEDLGVGRVEWRGQILHVDSDTVRSFEDWPELVELIAQALQSFSVGAGQAPSGALLQAK